VLTFKSFNEIVYSKIKMQNTNDSKETINDNPRITDFTRGHS